MSKKNVKLPVIPGWIVKREGNQIVLFNDSNGSHGIRVDVNKTKRTLEISAWYDTCVVFQGAEISFNQIEELF